jgi:hypothetical protein
MSDVLVPAPEAEASLTITEEEATLIAEALRKLDEALVGLLEETRGLKRDLAAWRQGDAECRA